MLPVGHHRHIPRMMTTRSDISLQPTEPDRNCPLCPRLEAFRLDMRARTPLWHNAPVPSFGKSDARLLIVGLAPGMHGANRTGRPFTGDYAGDLLYATLGKFGFAHGHYAASPDDGLQLDRTLITNAVRCLPPQNKPLPVEITTCRPFLGATLADLPDLRVIITLGKIAHESTVRALGKKLSEAPFKHGGDWEMAGHSGQLHLLSSYHCSRYNTNTRVLTPAMFEAVFARARTVLDAPR